MKRRCVRGIVVTEEGLAVIFRRKNGKEYYVIPGGGIEEGETNEEGLIRELKEELNIQVKINDLAFQTENDDRVEYFYNCDFVNGTFELNGEELDRMNKNNYYEPMFLNINEIENYDVQKEVKEYFRKHENK